MSHSSSASTVSGTTPPAPDVDRSSSTTAPAPAPGPDSPDTLAPTAGDATSTTGSPVSTTVDPGCIQSIHLDPAVQQPTDTTGQEISQYRQYAIIAALASGTPYAEICQTHRVSSATLAKLSKRMQAIDAVTTAKLMQANTLDALEAWRTAMRMGALDGKHAPAKDWLLHSKALDPVAESASPSLKVAIVLGMPGQSISGQVLDAARVTPTDGQEDQ